MSIPQTVTELKATRHNLWERAVQGCETYDDGVENGRLQGFRLALELLHINLDGPEADHKE